MTIPKSGLLLSMALALTVTAAGAAEDTGSANYILQGCRDFVNLRHGFNQGFCAGVVRGVANMGVLLSVGDLAEKKMRNLQPDALPPLPVPGSFAMELATLHHNLCLNIPSKVTNAQLVKVVLTYIEAQPARLHENFVMLALEALRTAWPCP